MELPLLKKSKKYLVGCNGTLPKFQTLVKKHKQRIKVATVTVVANWFVKVEICTQSLDLVTGIDPGVLTDFEKPYTVAIEQPSPLKGRFIVVKLYQGE